jgi:hypothetical protein
MELRRVSEAAWCLMAGASTCALVYTNRTRKRTSSSTVCGDCLVVSRLSPSGSVSPAPPRSQYARVDTGVGSSDVAWQGACCVASRRPLGSS